MLVCSTPMYITVAYAHETLRLIHAVSLQVFTYPNLSPMSISLPMPAMSGVISPTTMSLFTSPVTTPRTTPRSTPIPRWSQPFITLEDADYAMIAGLIPTGNADDALLNDGKFFVGNGNSMQILCTLTAVAVHIFFITSIIYKSHHCFFNHFNLVIFGSHLHFDYY